MWALFLPYLPALASGVLLAWSFPTFHLWPLAWVALVPLFRRTARLTPLPAAVHFVLAGWVFHTIVLQWLAANIFWAGGWAVLGQQGLVIALSAFWGVTGAGWAWCRRRAPQWVGAGALAVFWGLMEWLQSWVFTGFGWGALGYSQGANLAIAQLAAIGGVSLISCLVVAVNALVAQAWLLRDWRWRPAAAAAILASAWGLGGLLLDAPAPGAGVFRVGLYQSRYPQEMKWDWEYAEEMVQRAAAQSARLAEFEQVDLFVWPEALLVDHYDDPGMIGPVRTLATETGAAVLTGCTRLDPDTGANYNSAVLVNPDGAVAAVYDKVRLALMGEYVPFEEQLPFLKYLTPGGGMSPGDAPVLMPFRDRKLGPLICFEVLFGFMAEDLRAMGADCLVVVTNLGWFGASNAIAQELELARFRAIETRLPLIHSSNTGISGVFDPWGRFAVIAGAVGPGGRYYAWRPGELAPHQAAHRRMVGALEVPGKAARPLPIGPPAFPWAVCVLSAIVAAGAAAAPRFARRVDARKTDPRDRISI